MGETGLLMARQELGPAGLRVAQAVRKVLREVVTDGLPAGRSTPPRPVQRIVVGVSGGADSLALVAGAAWCSRRVEELAHVPVCAVVVDHGLQEGPTATRWSSWGTPSTTRPRPYCSVSPEGPGRAHSPECRSDKGGCCVHCSACGAARPRRHARRPASSGGVTRTTPTRRTAGAASGRH